MTAPRVPSLTVRLVAAALLWTALLLGGGGIVLKGAFDDTVERQFGQRLDALLKAQIAALQVGADGRLAVTRPLGEPRFERIFSGWYWQVTPPSGELLRSRSLWDSTLPVHPAAHGVLTDRIAGPNGEALLAVERDVTLDGVAGPVHVLVAADLGEIAAETGRFDSLLAAALVAMGLGLAVAVVAQVRFGLRPLRVLGVDLQAVRDGERARLAGRYPREVAPLAEAMNQVLDHDAVLIDRARTHVGNLAHGLKTPLAVLAAEASGSPDPATVRAQVLAMTRQVEHHLARASAVAGAGRALGRKVPVAPVADDIVRVLQRVHADKGLSFEVAVEDAAAFRGERQDLEEIVGNLADNAAKWARTRVRITARGGLTLVVEDDGPGLTPEQAEDAARRGSRLDETTPGWGLGLAIVADIAALNGGAVAYGRSELGGLRVSVTFGG